MVVEKTDVKERNSNVQFCRENFCLPFCTERRIQVEIMVKTVDLQVLHYLYTIIEEKKCLIQVK